MTYNSDILTKEPLELWLKNKHGSRLNDMELFTKELNIDQSEERRMQLESCVIEDRVHFIGNMLFYRAMMKQTHIESMLSQGKDSPLALKLAVLKLLSKTENAFVTIINMSYDPKRRSHLQLAKDYTIETYNEKETLKKIADLSDLARGKKPAPCKNLDWYKDGGRNRKIKCELCPYNTKCSSFNSSDNAARNLLK